MGRVHSHTATSIMVWHQITMKWPPSMVTRHKYTHDCIHTIGYFIYI